MWTFREMESLCIVSGNIKCYNHSGKNYGVSSKIKKQRIKIELSFDTHIWILRVYIYVYIKSWKQYLEEIFAHLCSLQQYLQYARGGSKLNVQLWMTI